MQKIGHYFAYEGETKTYKQCFPSASCKWRDYVPVFEVKVLPAEMILSRERHLERGLRTAKPTLMSVNGKQS